MYVLKRLSIIRQTISIQFGTDLEHKDYHEKFDIIYNQMVLHHVNDVETIFNKFYGLLNSGGYLAIADLYTEDGSFHGPEVKVHWGFNPDNLSTILKNKGFKNIKCKTCFEIQREPDKRYPHFFTVSTKIRMYIRKIIFILVIIFFSTRSGFTQVISGCENVSAFSKSRTPDMGIVISSGDAETVWNALRLGIAAQSKGDSVVVFVISKAVDVFIKDTSKFNISKVSTQFVSNGGDIYTCATCAKMRHTDNVQMCTITSIYDLYEIVKRSKKVVTF